MSDIYYNAKQRGYKSQFLPLPFTAIQGALLNKQKKYDTNKALIDEYSDYKINALPGDDTDFARGREGEVQDFITKSATQDLADPQYMRQFTSLIKSLKDDEGIKTVENAYNHHLKKMARDEELNKKGGYALAGDWEREYNEAYNAYTKPGSGGYKNLELADYNIREGINEYAEEEKLFNDIPVATTQTRKSIQGPKGIIWYNTSVSEVSPERIAQRAIKGVQDYDAPGHPVGEQIKLRYHYLVEDAKKGKGAMPTFDSDLKAAFVKKSKGDEMTAGEYLFSELYDVGMERYNPSYKTDIAKALNTANTQQQEIDEAYAQKPVMNVFTQTTETEKVNATTASELLKTRTAALNEYQDAIVDVQNSTNKYKAAYEKIAAASPGLTPSDIHKMIVTDASANYLTATERDLFATENPHDMMTADYIPLAERQLIYSKDALIEAGKDIENRLTGALADNYDFINSKGSSAFYKDKKLYDDILETNPEAAASMEKFQNLSDKKYRTLLSLSYGLNEGVGGTATSGTNSDAWYVIDKNGRIKILDRLGNGVDDVSKEQYALFEKQGGWSTDGTGNIGSIAGLVEKNGIEAVMGMKISGMPGFTTIGDIFNQTSATGGKMQIGTGNDPYSNPLENIYQEYHSLQGIKDSYTKIDAFKNGNVRALTQNEINTYQDPHMVSSRARMLSNKAKDLTYFDLQTKKVQPSTMALLDNYKKNLNGWQIVVNGKVLNQTGVDVPKFGTIGKGDIDANATLFTSERMNRTDGGRASFEATIKIKRVKPDPKDASKTITVTETVPAIFTLTGTVNNEQFDKLRSKELYSNYLSDPNSPSGRRDYINSLSYSNPKLSEKLFDMEIHNSGVFYKHGNVEFDVTPLSDQQVHGATRYTMDVKWLGKTGEETATINADNIAMLSGKIQAISSYQEAKEKKDKGIWSEEEWVNFLQGYGK